MSVQVYYRKFRPQTFGEVAGQEHITQTLRNAVASGRIAHAYLFCGPRGTGKTSTGRILAKAVNCLKPVQGEPCNTCTTCLAHTEGRAIDIIEIDAASNRGIDDIRELRQNVAYSPNVARYKVYIVDEVHMLSDPASNALLKTLEEPPPHAIFVLATTESHKVLPTILSRCQRFDFRRISQSAVVARLGYICECEGLTVPLEALRLISRAATGSLRDAANLLEQVVAFYGKTASFEQVKEMLGVTGDARVRQLAKHVIARATAAGLQTVAGVNADGLDLRQFNREVVQYLRDLLLVKSGSEETVDVTGEDMADMKKLAASVSLDSLLKIVRIFNEVDLRQDYSPLPLELAVVESTLTDEKAVPARTVKVAETPKPAVGVGQIRSFTGSPSPVPPATISEKPPSASAPETVPVRVPQTASAGTVTEPTVSSFAQAEPKPSGPIDLAWVRAHWKDFVESMRGMGSSGNMDAYLRSVCEPENLEGDVITLAFRYDFHKAKIEDPKYCHLVEKKMAEVFGHPLHIRCVLKERGKSESPAGGADNYMARAAMKMGARVVARKPVTEE